MAGDLIAVASNPYSCSVTGGVFRAWRSVRAYARAFRVTAAYLVGRGAMCPEPIVEVPDGVRLAGFRPRPPLDSLVGSRAGWLFTLIPSRTLASLAGLGRAGLAGNAVMALHETSDVLSLSRAIAECLGVPAGALLQSPPFYGDRGRLERIREAFELHYRLLYPELLSLVPRLVNLKFYTMARSERVKGRLLGSFSMLLAVSRSIPLEMGGSWAERVAVLDPGVTVDPGLLEAAERLREARSGNYVVAGGRPDPEKGLVEAVIAFSLMARRRPDLRLYIAGHAPGDLGARIERLARRLGVGDRVVLTGVLPREEMLRLVAGASLLLYPSHADSYSLVVHESLALGTPVAAYRIPALEVYYSRLEGVELVDEGDVEELAEAALSIVDDGPARVEAPKARGWDEILEEEVSIVRRFLLGG